MAVPSALPILEVEGNIRIKSFLLPIKVHDSRLAGHPANYLPLNHYGLRYSRLQIILHHLGALAQGIASITKTLEYIKHLSLHLHILPSQGKRAEARGGSFKFFTVGHRPPTKESGSVLNLAGAFSLNSVQGLLAMMQVNGDFMADQTSFKKEFTH